MEKPYLVLLCKKLRSCHTSIVKDNTNVQQIRKYKMAVRQLPKKLPKMVDVGGSMTE